MDILNIISGALIGKAITDNFTDLHYKNVWRVICKAGPLNTSKRCLQALLIIAALYILTAAINSFDNLIEALSAVVPYLKPYAIALITVELMARGAIAQDFVSRVSR